MNDSKKLLYVRLIVAIVVILFLGLFIFLIIKIDVVGHLFGDKHYIRTSTSSNLNRYLDEVNSREFKIKERKKRIIEETKKERAEEIEDKSIFKYINRIKEKRNKGVFGFRIINNRTEGIKQNTKTEVIAKGIKMRIDEIQKLYDNGYHPKSSWILIDDDNDNYGFNYYFNDKGKLIVDTVTPDYRIVDVYGREIDDDLEPILYKVEAIYNNNEATSSEVTISGNISTQVILSPGVILKEKSEYYDNRMNRKVIDYIDTSLRFKKTTNGTIYNGSKWKSVSSLRDDGGYVIFNNPNNNFNKIIGKITTQKLSGNEDAYTKSTLLVYDADLYELYREYEDLLEPLYETSAFNFNEPLDFAFTFYRTVKRIRFQVVTNGDDKHRTCYLKDLRYGFDKSKYKEELEEAKEQEEYIAYMKELGIYQSEEELLAELKALDEDSSSDYLEYEDFNDIELYDNVDLSDFDRDIDKAQLAIDRRTGPAFDEYLRSLKNYWEIEYGPGFE